VTAQGATSFRRGLPLEQAFWLRVDKRGADECWHWQGSLDRKGYGQIEINGIRRRATHVSLELHRHTRPSPQHGACHTCDNPPCVNPAHLWWGTAQDNATDMCRKGRSNKWNGRRQGENHPRAKLSNADVVEIKRLRGKESQSSLAARFGVSPNGISAIHTGRLWTHIEVTSGDG
jgi:hypothetical protein